MENLRKIKIFLVFYLAVCSLFLSGCYKKEALKDTENRKNIDFIVKMRNGDYWYDVERGANAAAKEFNVNLNFIAPDSEMDIESQIKEVQESINKKSDALILAPSDYKELTPITEKVYENKIPVIVVDTGINTDKITSYISTNNYIAGREAAEKIIGIVGENSKVAVMSFVKGSKNAEEREEGVLDELKKHPNIEIVATEYCQSSEKLAEEFTKNIIERNNKIDGVIALNSIAAIGAAQAVEELGLAGKVKIVAFDSTPIEVKYIENGTIQAALVQSPFSIGYLGVKYAAISARGQKVPKSVETDFKLIDKNNMYLAENQKLVFPFQK